MTGACIGSGSNENCLPQPTRSAAFSERPGAPEEDNQAVDESGSLLIQTESRILPVPRGCVCDAFGPPAIDRRLNLSAWDGSGQQISDVVVLRARVDVAENLQAGQDTLGVCVYLHGPRVLRE